MDEIISRILVVEDDPEDYLLVKKALKAADESSEMVNADTVEKAIALLKNEKFDLILSDLSLPDSQGLETVAQIMQQATAIPVIVLTGLKDEETGLKAIQLGAQDFLNKDAINRDILKRVIRYSMERKSLDRLKDDFVSAVSHELRTPLTVIKERASQISDGILGETTEKQVKALAAVTRNVERLEHIINNLLDLAKIQAGKVKLHKEPANIVELADEICDSLDFKAKEKELGIVKNFEQDAIELSFDRIKIYQVFINLINNAIKFTDKGQIEVLIKDFPEKVECSIIDSGCGLSEEDLGKLFNKFQQFGQQTSAQEKGSGLGLAISKGLIELHGGTISVESQLGKGTCFRFELPKC